MTFHGLRLKSVLALAFGLMAIVLAACLTLLIARHSGEAERLAASTRLGSIAEVTAHMLDLGMHERLHDVLLLAEADVLLERPDAGRRLLASLQAGHPEYAWLGVVDLEGRVLYASHGQHEGGLLAEHAVWQAASPDRSYLGDLHANDWLPPLLGSPPAGEDWRFVDISTPLAMADGLPQGRVVAFLSWEWARQLIDSMRTPARRAAGIEFFIVDQEGRLLLAPRGKADTVLPPLATLGNPASALRWPDGEAYLSNLRGGQGWRDYPGQGWQVVVRQPADKAFAGVHLLQRYIIGAGLALALLFALIGMGLAWFLSRPLTQLARNADHLRQHPDSVALHEGGVFRETRQLSRSFGQLLQERQEHENDLARLNAGLEQQVQDRTRAVEAANRHLLSLLEERGKLMEQLENLASTDSLTGLLNRRAFQERADLECKRAQRQGSPLSAFTFDIDHFKQVNDNYGHDIGDEALRQCAAACREQLREIDIVARFGGEEFVILLPETDTEAARVVAERLREALAALVIPTPKGDLRFTASFGVAPHEPDTQLATTLQRADQALYAAKHSGRNRVVVAF